MLFFIIRCEKDEIMPEEIPKKFASTLRQSFNDARAKEKSEKLGETAEPKEKKLDETPSQSPSETSVNQNQMVKMPKIRADEGDLALLTDRAWDAIQQANNPPFLFLSGGVLVRLKKDQEDQIIVELMTKDKMRFLLAECAKWYKKKENTPAHPPPAVVNNVLARPDMPLPILTRIVNAPIFSKSGDIQTKPGYHPDTQTYYHAQKNFMLENILKEPTEKDVAKAKSLILGELLVDFPFAGESEQAHAVAMLLLPFVRELVVSSTPIHLIEKPTPGTGGTLLVQVLTYVAKGEPITAMTEGRDEDEWRKRITATLKSGSQFVFIDNLQNQLQSSSIAAAITAEVWEDRILGHSENIRIPVKCIWIVTGNNPAFSSEIARRLIRIRLDAKTPQPWLRQKFRHHNLNDWVKRHRNQLVWACLTLIKAWIVKGKPTPKGLNVLGMFESWSEVMGGILDVVNIPGFLGNLKDFYAASDSDSDSWHPFIVGWHKTYQDKPVGVSKLYTLNERLGTPIDLGATSDVGQRTKLGKAIAKMRDRHFAIDDFDYRIVLDGTSQRAKKWRLKREVIASSTGDNLKED